MGAAEASALAILTVLSADVRQGNEFSVPLFDVHRKIQTYRPRLPIKLGAGEFQLITQGVVGATLVQPYLLRGIINR